MATTPQGGLEGRTQDDPSSLGASAQLTMPSGSVSSSPPSPQPRQSTTTTDSAIHTSPSAMLVSQRGQRRPPFQFWFTFTPPSRCARSPRRQSAPLPVLSVRNESKSPIKIKKLSPNSHMDANGMSITSPLRSVMVPGWARGSIPAPPASAVAPTMT